MKIAKSLALAGTAAALIIAPAATASAAVGDPAPTAPLIGACDSKPHPGPAKKDLSAGVTEILVEAPHCVVDGAQKVLGGLTAMLNPSSGDDADKK